MAYFNKNEETIFCNKEEISFNFMKVKTKEIDYFKIIDEAEVSVTGIENITQQIKDNYSHTSVAVVIEDSYEGVEIIHLRTNYVGVSPLGVFRGKIAEYSPDSKLGKLIIKEFKLFLEKN